MEIARDNLRTEIEAIDCGEAAPLEIRLGSTARVSLGLLSLERIRPD